MKATDLRASLDLTATLALALAGLLAALLVDAVWLRTAVLLPLVLLLPGYAIGAALFPPGALPAAERATYAIALSIAATVLSGVVVQLLVGLDRTVWAVVLFGLVAAASLVALRRRARAGAAWVPSPPLGRVDLASALALAATVPIAAVAIAISSDGARQEREEIAFTELWTMPEPDGEGAVLGAVSIGVVNDEGERESYRVRAIHGNETLASWRVELDDGARWKASLPAPPITARRPLKVELLRDGEVYRRTVIRDAELPS